MGRGVLKIIIGIMILLCCPNYLIAAGTKTPHDYEFNENLCKHCHGVDIFGKSNSIYGEPATGKHTNHMEYIRSKESSSDKNNLFWNATYSTDEKDEFGTFFSHWDKCDECHETSLPNKLDDLHLNKKTDISIKFNNNKCDAPGGCHEKYGTTSLNWNTSGAANEAIIYNYYGEEFKQDNCVICHFPSMDMARDNKTQLFLKSDIVSMCNDCHGENKRYETKVSHPLNVKIDEQIFLNREIPEKFGMDKYYYNTITCSTCHDPHGESCRTCHFNLNNNKVYKNQNVSIVRKKAYLKIENSFDVVFDYDMHTFKKEVFFQQPPYLEDPELKKVRDSLCNPCHTLETSLKVDVKDPHKEKKCIHCHRTIPTDPDEMCINLKALEATNLQLRKGVSRVEAFLKFDVLTICNNCHKDKKHLHPINVKSKKKVSSDLKLDQWDQVTCTTCHDAHTNYSNKKDVVLYRRESDKEGLCYICHANDPDFIKNNPHDFNNRNKCAFCHATDSSTTEEGMKILKERKPGLYNKEFITRCNVCHMRNINTHKIGVFLQQEDMVSNYRLDIQDRLTCGTCHDYHFVEKIILEPKIKKGIKDFCSQCHRDIDEVKNTLENIKKEIVK